MDSQPAPALSIVDQARQRAEEKLHPANSGETTSDVQMETAQPVEDENDNAVSAGEGADEPPAQTTAVNMSKILAERCPDLTAEVLKSQVSSAHSDEEEEAEQAAPAWPEYFEPGRYEGVPNEVYHAANGISSTMVKDARVSLMYFEARHVSKTIQKVRSLFWIWAIWCMHWRCSLSSWKKNSASSRKSRKAPSPRRRRSARLSTNTTPGFRRC
jgi:exodeoxyribonuclease VIII